jgi:hypothetical protein
MGSRCRTAVAATAGPARVHETGSARSHHSSRRAVSREPQSLNVLCVARRAWAIWRTRFGYARVSPVFE